MKKIGFSSYKTKDLLKYTKKFKFDFIQFPLNILDQRILDQKVLKELRYRDVEIHIRSIYLQGLLLISKNNLPSNFKKNLYLKRWHKFLLENKISAIEACADFIKINKIYSKAIVGFDNYKQFLEFFKHFSKRKTLNLNYKYLAVNRTKLVNPSKWR